MGWLTIEKEQNTNHTQVSQTCISKTKLIFFYGRCRVVHCALFLRVQQRTVAPFLNPDLTNKSWVVHLNCTLMACGELCVAISHRYLEILDFTQFFDHFVFTPNAENVLEKELKREIPVSVGIELVVVDMRK